MPKIDSTYNPPLVFKNGHLATIYSGLVRRVNGLNQQRERLELPDGDFLDLDWSFADTPTEKAVILLHGLEEDLGKAIVDLRQGIDRRIRQGSTIRGTGGQAADESSGKIGGRMHRANH